MFVCLLLVFQICNRYLFDAIPFAHCHTLLCLSFLDYFRSRKPLEQKLLELYLEENRRQPSNEVEIIFGFRNEKIK